MPRSAVVDEICFLTETRTALVRGMEIMATCGAEASRRGGRENPETRATAQTAIYINKKTREAAAAEPLAWEEGNELPKPKPTRGLPPEK